MDKQLIWSPWHELKIMIKQLLTLNLLFIGSGFNIYADNAVCYPETIYVVRHVEKQRIPGVRDVDLSPTGYQHAQALDEKLKKIKFDRVIATEYKRTQLTVKPVARRNNKILEIFNANEVSVLAGDILKSCDQTIIVAGHSNTVPKLLKALGLTFKVTINGQRLNHDAEIYLNEKEDYDSLFKVYYSKEGQASVVIERF